VQQLGPHDVLALALMSPSVMLSWYRHLQQLGPHDVLTLRCMSTLSYARDKAEIPLMPLPALQQQPQTMGMQHMFSAAAGTLNRVFMPQLALWQRSRALGRRRDICPEHTGTSGSADAPNQYSATHPWDMGV
jgi:hypothetical protein